MKLTFRYDDGGRAAAGFKGNSAGDCVTRAVAITTGLPYREVYEVMAEGNARQRVTKKSGRRAGAGIKSAAHGIWTKRKWFRDWMVLQGFRWVPTMQIGSGCTVHLADDELPSGTLIAAVSGHYTAILDGEIRDTYDPRRETHCVEPDHGGPLKPGQWRNENGICSIQRRCVYGYWIKETGV